MKTVEFSTLTGHTRSVRSVVFSPAGSTLVSASLDCTIKLWDPKLLISFFKLAFK
ncbi:MAG: WD40 repeat domain-containing protein [Candidatus Poribacteria bacterium]|nr:WD40 repeat domain-containing protein [Candidatus Poribacteria bacterium]